jgi:hypothetical protein
VAVFTLHTSHTVLVAEKCHFGGGSEQSMHSVCHTNLIVTKVGSLP